jgi:FtsH-binding integral membrane protein
MLLYSDIVFVTYIVYALQINSLVMYTMHSVTTYIHFCGMTVYDIQIFQEDQQCTSPGLH